VTPDRLRKLALELPDVTEEHHGYGSYYRLRGHLIAQVPAGERTAFFYVGKDTVRARRKTNGAHTFSFKPRWAWIRRAPFECRIAFRSLTDDDVRELLAEAWHLVPPTTLSRPDYRGSGN
jgi:hypothetical protein